MQRFAGAALKVQELAGADCKGQGFEARKLRGWIQLARKAQPSNMQGSLELAHREIHVF